MAEDNTLRNFRLPESSRRTETSAGAPEHSPGSDPLAELARLIGQNDPFAEFGRANSRPPELQQPSAPQSQSPSAYSPGWRKGAPVPGFGPKPELGSELLPAPRYSDVPPVPPRYSESSPAPRFPESQSVPQMRYSEPMPTAVRRSESSEISPRHDESQFAAAPAPSHLESPIQAGILPAGIVPTGITGSGGIPMESPSLSLSGLPRSTMLQQDTEGDQFAYRDGYGAPHSEDYDDPPRSRRHGGVVTAGVLIACAMLGTAGAYGYRTYYAGPGSMQAPPVITADKTPNKVIPAASDQSNKTIQDRLGEQGSKERMVSREEKPVDLREPPAVTAPRVVLPSPIQSVAQVPPTTASTSTGSSGEPKRVRTVTIRADGTDAGGRPVGGIPPSASQPAERPPATRPPPARTPRSVPLSLDPQVNSADPPVQSAPPATVPAAPRLAATPSSPTRSAGGAATGSYSVQVSSQRSEQEAHTSYRAMQSKYPELAGKQHTVRRVELTGKGTFYRAMVGPFASAEEAGQFCSGLKAAGGQCLIQKN